MWAWIARWNINPHTRASGSATSGTTTSQPPIIVIMIRNSSANGTSVSTNSEVEVSTPRTISKPFTCAASVPTEAGRASMRMPSMRWKNHSDSS